MEWISLAVNSALTAALVWVAVAQWKASAKQTDIAESLQKLEFARSAAPKIEFKTVGRTIKFEKLAGSVELPQAIEVTPSGGISAIRTIDVDANLFLIAGESTGCVVTVRGLYLYGNRKLSLSVEARERLGPFLVALGNAGISATSASMEARVKYVDIFRSASELYFDIEESSPAEVVTSDEAPVLYNGLWSGRPGLYFDEAEKFEGDCRKLSRVLRAAAAAR